MYSDCYYLPVALCRQWFCPIWNLFITPTQNTFSSKIALCKRCFLCNQAVTEGQYKESCLIFWEIIILSKTSRKLYLYRLKWPICVWYLFFLSDHIPAILQIYQSTHKYAQCPHCLHIHVLVKHKSLNPLNAPHYAQALQPHLSSGQQKTFALSSTSWHHQLKVSWEKEFRLSVLTRISVTWTQNKMCHVYCNLLLLTDVCTCTFFTF